MGIYQVILPDRGHPFDRGSLDQSRPVANRDGSPTAHLNRMLGWLTDDASDFRWPTEALKDVGNRGHGH